MNRRDFLKTGTALALTPALLPHIASAQTPAPALPPAGADGWISLLNGRDFTGWYSVLDKSGRGVAEQKNIIAIESEMLHILGNQVGAPGNETHYEPGYLATNQEFENVRIRVEYKWGVKQFYPRSLAKRDNGLLYGVVGPDKVFPTCAECQIEEGDTGDFYLIGGVRGIQTPHPNGLSGMGISPTSGWPKQTTPSNRPPAEPTSGRLIKDGDFENLDQWNTVEVIWQGDKAVHIVNGRAVNAVTGLQRPDPQNPGQFIPLTRGRIAIEIEFAEIWFRRIEVKAIG